MRRVSFILLFIKALKLVEGRPIFSQKKIGLPSTNFIYSLFDQYQSDRVCQSLNGSIRFGLVHFYAFTKTAKSKSTLDTLFHTFGS